MASDGGMNGEYELERKRSWPNPGTILTTVWKNREKQQESSLKVADVPAEIWTKHTVHEILQH
jgi:hypothetical protein